MLRTPYRSRHVRVQKPTLGSAALIEELEHRRLYTGTPAVLGSFKVTNLVSDLAGNATAKDSHLINAWGLAFDPATDTVRVANNGSGDSTVYNPNGVLAGDALSATVTIPTPNGAGKSAPTGEVFNSTGNFFVQRGKRHRAAVYMWATEDGTIAAWTPSVNATTATIEVDNSASNAVYKGLAMATHKGHSFIYATDFHNGRVDVFNSNFSKVTLRGRFIDHQVPKGFAPFGIQNMGGNIFVTYAMQDSRKHDDVAGPGNGYVDEFSDRGVLLKRFASGGTLDSPWGMIQAPATFGALAGDILIGNFGDGRISAFNPINDVALGVVGGSNHQPAVINGLWGMTFGTSIRDDRTLFFTAGPNGEVDGLLGTLSFATTALDPR